MIDQKPRILLVEDNQGDIRFLQEALGQTDIPHHLDVVSDGDSALLFLKKEGLFATVRKPNLILLDISLPKIDGHEVLAYAKGHHALCCIPVVVFSVANTEREVDLMYRHHANAFVAKPFDLHVFTEVVKTIQHFWLKIAKLPPSDD